MYWGSCNVDTCGQSTENARRLISKQFSSGIFTDDSAEHALSVTMRRVKNAHPPLHLRNFILSGSKLRYLSKMQTLDFDFGRYVNLRKGARQASRREGTAYAFSADLRLLRKIERLGPIPTVLEEAGRLFQRQAQKDLLTAAVLATPDHYPFVAAAAKICAERLHLSIPPVYVTQDPKEPIPVTVGVFEESYILFPAALLEQLSQSELLFAIGAECGRIQNGHIPLRTALFYITHVPTGFVRLMVAPARSILGVWLRRANITADRAGLLCSRSMEASQSALKKILHDSDKTETLRRENSLLRFAESQYFRTLLNLPGGESQDSCDEAVATLLDEKPRQGEG